MFLSITPHVFVQDLDTALRFYSVNLGFTVDFVYGEPGFYAHVSRDGVRLALRLVDGPVWLESAQREREQLLSAYIVMSDLESLENYFAACKATGTDMYEGLVDQPWGARTFIVRDPYGNLIQFASFTSPQAAG